MSNARTGSFGRTKLSPPRGHAGRGLKGLVAAAGVALLACAAGPGSSAPPDAKSDQRPAMTQEEFERLHKMIKPQPGEWKFAEIPWAKTVREAREKSAAEGKPLLIWYMVGEPLGQC
jgi:hypothetical protein